LVNETPSPALTVSVEDASGNVVTGDTSSVTLTIAAGPSGATLGNATVAAVNGVATFNSVYFDTPGTYTLIASDGSLMSGMSADLNVNASAPSYSINYLPIIGLGTKDPLAIDSAGNLYVTGLYGVESGIFEVASGSTTLTTLAHFSAAT